MIDEIHEHADGRLFEALAVSETKICPTCKGAGYPPERWMGDPEGQKPCKTCNGTGKVPA